MLKISAWLLLFGAIGVCAALSWTLYFSGSARAGCEQRDILSHVTSPDSVWTATTFYNVCSDGWFVTTVTNTVEIARAGEPTGAVPSGGVVLGVDTLSLTKEEIVILWRTNEMLEILVPPQASVGKQLSQFNSIVIVYPGSGR